MKNRILILSILLFFGLSTKLFAVSSPTVATLPESVDANTYELTIFCDKGATITVVGGPADIAPVTDGRNGDLKDGKVQVMVAVAQNTTNTYSITCKLNGDTSSSALISIKEVSTGSGNAPPAPALDKIPDYVTALDYIITGSSEPNANIYVRKADGTKVGTTKASATGGFRVTVPLEAEKTNRFNVSAEYPDGEEGPATQAVIRQTANSSENPNGTDPDTPAQINFNDVVGHWAEDYINQLYEKGVVSGKSEGVFDPDGLITRAELTKIAILAFGHSVNTSVSEPPFSDVVTDSWFAPYVEEAKRLGFVQGYESGGFGPNDYVNRAAALKILLGAAELSATGMLADFPDVPLEAWFASYVGYAQAHDIVTGYTDGRFGPGDFMTRAQVAKVVIKLLDTLKVQ